MKVIQKKYIPLVEVRDYLKKSDREIYGQKIAYEYAKSFSKLKPKDAEKLMEELKGLNIQKLNDEYITKIVDILPGSLDEIRTILSSSTISFKNEEIKKIFDVVSKYR